MTPPATGRARPEQQTITNETFPVWKGDERNRAVLVRMDSIQAGHVTSLGDAIRLGRHSDNTVVVDDEGISRMHARVVYEGGQYFVEDLGSSNGTYVNGERIERQVLVDGAVVQLGPRVHFRFSVTDENQERILRQLYESSVRDALTRAYNRHFFLERLDAELAYATRHRSQGSVLIFDIDHFKKVNDTHGHLAGDAVLKNVASTTEFLLRTEDLLARYGGEEFVVLLRGITLSGAARAAERLRKALEELRTVHDGRSLAVTISIGCASFACVDRVDRERLVAVADRRLYAAKRDGRNRVVAAD